MKTRWCPPISGLAWQSRWIVFCKLSRILARICVWCVWPVSPPPSYVRSAYLYRHVTQGGADAVVSSGSILLARS